MFIIKYRTSNLSDQEACDWYRDNYNNRFPGHCHMRLTDDVGVRVARRVHLVDDDVVLLRILVRGGLLIVVIPHLVT